MDFTLSDEHKLLQETVKSFVARECPPARVREVVESEAGDASTIWRGLLALGLGGLVVPERYGGAELALLDAALAAEVLGHGAVPAPFLGHTLACLAIAVAGDERTRERWLPRLASGELLGTVALADEGGAWEPERWTAAVTAQRVTGSKPFVPCARAADLLVVGVAGGGLALVERAAQGARIEPIDTSDRTRPLDRVELDGAPCTLLAGSEAGARVRDAGLALLAADAFGGASRLIEMSAEYARTRVQFGQPIGQFQGVKHQLADLAAALEPARALYWYAAYAFDALPQEASRAAALAKAHLTDRFIDVARGAVEIHGGLGFTWDCDVQIWYKRALFDRAFLGTPETQRERCAALAGW